MSLSIPLLRFIFILLFLFLLTAKVSIFESIMFFA
jgi:hypothetical protein